MIQFRWLFLFSLSVVVFFTLFTPTQLINQDSVYGFDALNGPAWTGKTNTYFIYDQPHQRFTEHFLTWWSPGQYAVPGFFMRTLGLSLGKAITLVNGLCLLFGVLGFALLFRKYSFEGPVLSLSVLLVLFSGALLSRYYSYQGGESLNFLLFPWILVTEEWLLKKYLSFLLPGVVLLIAFFFKLQLLILVPPLLLLLDMTRRESFPQLISRNEPAGQRLVLLGRLASRSIPVLISIIWAFFLIYKGFISRGATPASANPHFAFKWLNLLVPLASPLTSVYAGEAGFMYWHTEKMQDIYLLFCSGLVIAGIILIIRDWRKVSAIKQRYIAVTLALFAFSVLVFTVLYSEGNVDYSPRHFKLTAFLLYPLFIESLLKRVGRRVMTGVTAVLILVAIGNHVRLTRSWLKDTSVTTSGFRLLKTDMPVEMKRRLDSMITTRTVVVSPYEDRYAIDNPLIMPVQLDSTVRPTVPSLGYPVIYVTHSEIITK